MKERILLLCKDRRKIQKLNGVLHRNKYSLHIEEGKEFMRSLFIIRPSIILIDLDGLSQRDLEVIGASLKTDYIPTYCFYEDDYNPAIHSSDFFILPFEELLKSLLNYLALSSEFSKRYFGLSNAYETIRNSNEIISSFSDVFLAIAGDREDEFIRSILQQIYYENLTIESIPCCVRSVEMNEEGVVFTKYYDKFTKYEASKVLELTDGLELLMAKSRETGLYTKFDNVNMSEISNIKQLLESYGCDVSDMNNIAIYSTDKYMLLGSNYSPDITSYDLDVLRNLCIRITALKNYKSNVKGFREAFIYTMNALARTAEGKDEIVGEHIYRVNKYSQFIATKLELPMEFIFGISNVAQMHDVGKISINEGLLNKPGKLTCKEFEKMKRHTVFGERIIGKSKSLELAAEIARSHHEKYDGSGYPDGLVAEEIPISARIVALADIYDALRSERTYRIGFSHEKAIDIIINGDGRVMPSHFDPNVLNVFKEHHEVFREIFDTSKH